MKDKRVIIILMALIVVGLIVLICYRSEKDDTKLGTTVDNVVEERIRLSDLKIDTEGVDTKILVKFNGNIYGQSFALIDYAGDFNKPIGKIEILIDEKYLPQKDGETNCSELLGADVLEANEKAAILNVNNIARLFNVIEKKDIKKSNPEIFFKK